MRRTLRKRGDFAAFQASWELDVSVERETPPGGGAAAAAAGASGATREEEEGDESEG